MAHPTVQHRTATHAPSGRAIITCWAAVSAAILTISLVLLLRLSPSELVLREFFARDPSGTLQRTEERCGAVTSMAGAGGGSGITPVGSVFITSRTRHSAIVIWEETTVRWSPTPQPAAEVDAVLQKAGFDADARRIAMLPTGTTTTLRPSPGLFYVPLLSLLLVEPSFLLRRRWLDRRARIRTARGCCAACGYDRRGTDASAACPECGDVL